VFWSYGEDAPTRDGTAFIQDGRLVVGSGDVEIARMVNWLNSGRVKVMVSPRVYTPADGDLYLEKLHVLFRGQGGFVTVEDAPDA
jgi:hypothetical protein